MRNVQLKWNSKQALLWPVWWVLIYCNSSSRKRNREHVLPSVRRGSIYRVLWTLMNSDHIYSGADPTVLHGFPFNHWFSLILLFKRVIDKKQWISFWHLSPIGAQDKGLLVHVCSWASYPNLQQFFYRLRLIPGCFRRHPIIVCLNITQYFWGPFPWHLRKSLCVGSNPFYWTDLNVCIWISYSFFYHLTKIRSRKCSKLLCINLNKS